MIKPFQLTTEQIDDLKEVGNVGAGQAAARLSDLIHRPYMIDSPQVSFLDLEGIKKTFDAPDSFAVALHIRIMGDIPSIMFVIVKRTYAQRIIQYMDSSPLLQQAIGKELSFTTQIALKQVGELLTKSFSDAIHQFLMSKAKYAMPEIVIDNWSNALDVILSRLKQPEEVQLVLHSNFFDTERTVEGKFVYILNPDSQEMILNRISILLKGGNSA